MDPVPSQEKVVRLGIDFGENVTVIAVHDPDRMSPTLEIPGISRGMPGVCPESMVYVIPSLIHYHGDGTVSTGSDVVRAGLADNPATVSGMRRYLFDGSPARIPSGDGRTVACSDAAEEFLTGILSRAVALFGRTDLIFALPADAPAKYSGGLDRIGRASGARSTLWVNEYLAAAAGYGISPRAGDPFLILRFSETVISATVVIPEEASASGVRTAAEASASTGTRTVDTWIARDILARFRLLESDPRAERIRPEVFAEAQRAREIIPREGLAGIAATDPVQAKTYTSCYGAEDLLRVLEKNAVFDTVHQVLDRALSKFCAGAGDKTRIADVLLLGEGWILPGVQDCIQKHLPGTRVHADFLKEAVARGAAGYQVPTRAPDRITNSYALRYWDPKIRDHRFRFLVSSGARFPSQGQAARISISAAYDGQTHLGIPLWEIAGSLEKECGIELVADVSGGMRLAGPAEEAGAGDAAAVPVNERNPTLLVADPPAKKGEPRFECTFTIDREKNLCLSARDLLTGVLVKLNAPVYRMT
jgi:molecular chaperone DnaK (HSP70)